MSYCSIKKGIIPKECNKDGEYECNKKARSQGDFTPHRAGQQSAISVDAQCRDVNKSQISRTMCIKHI